MKEIYSKCLHSEEGSVQVSGLKLSQPTNVSLTNLDESVLIKWTDPNDIDLNGSPLAEYEGTVVVRKAGSAPKSKLDGVVVIDSKTRNEYKDTGFIDTGLTNGIEYYYGIFPYTIDGVYNFRYNQSIIPTAIYPDVPMNVKVFAGNEKIKVKFNLPENASGAKICYSTVEPESNTEVYGTIIENIESPHIITGVENDTPYYVTVYSTTEKNRDTAGNVIKVTPKLAEVYSFTINASETDPDSKITYGDDNVDYSPAHMDYDNDTFNYGSWADAFFMNVKPCMLKYSGEVDYYLNPNNVEYKEDGTPSDVANENYEGNAMVEFPKIYYKKTDVEGGATYTFSDQKLDEDYKCYSFINSKNEEIDNCYMPMYDGSLVNGKLRSLSGRAPMTNQNRQTEVNYAKANNTTEDIGWYTTVACDWLLVQLLLILISKSTDTGVKFGTGNCNSYVNNSNNGIKISGTLNDKGLFYGKNDKSTCVKVFGMENFWGNIWKSMAGWINDHGTQKIKLTYGTYDDSTVEGYNLNGTGYISIPDATPSGTSGGYISSVKFTKYGLIPYVASGTSTTHYCDGFWFNNGQNNYALVGGSSADGLLCGAFYLDLVDAWSNAYWNVGASLFLFMDNVSNALYFPYPLVKINSMERCC